MPGTKPHGREQVTAAIHAAAVELLAERGPRDVTVREIAERAGVNHALVHRHYGSKQELIASVVRAESQAIATATARPGTTVQDVVARLAEHPAYFRILARTVLDEPDMLGSQMPAASAFLDLLAGDASVDDSRRAQAIAAGSLMLGWLVFGRHLSSALDGPDDELVERTIAAAIGSIVS